MGDLNAPDPLEVALQQLERTAPIAEPCKNTPRWAGSIRPRRLEFLLTLCLSTPYQSIVARLREIGVRYYFVFLSQIDHTSHDFTSNS